MDIPDRVYLNFESQVKESFVFLENLGFSVVKALSTLVWYQCGNIVVDIYHGRQSYEVGAGITIFENRYAISEIIEVSDPKEFKKFRYAMTTTPEGVSIAVKELSILVEQYGNKVLRGDSKFISALEKQRKQWSEKFSLDVLTRQLRPRANEAFRRKDYLTAVELYSYIRERLSPVEIKKLSFAKDRCKKSKGS